MNDAGAALDGNAAAGDVAEVFAFEFTSATGQCAGCGRVAPMAETRLYVRAPGLVIRCAACERVLMRIVKAPGRTWIELQGLASLHFAVPLPARE